MSLQTNLEQNCLLAVVGEPAIDREWTAAVVLQGPYVYDKTARAVRTFLEMNDPTVLVIVSTYCPPDQPYHGAFLTHYERNIVIAKNGPHVGRLVYLLIRPPTRVEEPNFWATNYRNQNLQRLSSFVGLRYADSLHIQKSLKCRSDSFLGKPNICQYLNDNFVEKIPIIEREDIRCQPDKLKQRIVVSDYSQSHGDRSTKYNFDNFIADFWFFGRTSDLLTYFDIRAGSVWNGGSGIQQECPPEQTFGFLWRQEVGINGIRQIEEVFARYLAVVNTSVVEFSFGNSPHRFDYDAYEADRASYSRNFEDKMHKIENHILHQNWLDYVKKYTDRDLIAEFGRL